MTHTEVYDDYVEKLVKCLPMNDTLFITKLSQKRLLPGDTQREIKALPIATKKAEYLLDNVIKPALDIDNHSSFNKLLSVMKKCGYGHVEELSREIKSKFYKQTRGTSYKSGVVIIYNSLAIDLKFTITGGGS